MRGGGAVCLRGGVDGRPGEVLGFDLHPRDGIAENGGGDFRGIGTGRYLWI